MSDILSILRRASWYGGITINERDNSPGVAINVEELDIWENESYFGPTTIFASDSVVARKVTGYALDTSDSLYALSRDASGTPKAQIFKKTNAGATAPDAWASFFTSTGNANDYSPLAYHEVAGADYVYYVTGTNALVRHDLVTTESSVGTLDGIGSSFIRVPQLNMFGDTYFGHGQYIAKVFNDDGTFTQHDFTLPNGWEVVSMAPSGNYMAILARSTKKNLNQSMIFYWDLVETSGPVDQVAIPFGGPQAVVSYRGGLWVMCAKNGVLIVYVLSEGGPKEFTRLTNVATETSTQPIVPTESIFIKDNILYFGVWKTDKTGLYAIGRVNETKPFGIILGKRYATTDYSLHKPHAATSVGPNLYTCFDDNGTATNQKLEGANSPTRSSNALIETTYMDASSPEFLKTWEAFVLSTGVMPASCSIVSSFRTDSAASYNATTYTSSSSNDQTRYGSTDDTYFYRQLPGFYGRALQHKMAFTSSTTSRPIVYSTAYMYRNQKIG